MAAKKKYEEKEGKNGRAYYHCSTCPFSTPHKGKIENHIIKHRQKPEKSDPVSEPPPGDPPPTTEKK